MKLSSQHIAQIEKYLDVKELTQVDIRNEVIDHIAIGVEKSMRNDNDSFECAFNDQTQVWDEELKDYSSFWLGYGWVGPKLMMQKCVKEIKRTYFFSLLMAVTLWVAFIIMSQVVNITVVVHRISNILGVTCLGIFFLIIYAFYKMKNSGFDTSYRYLYKLNAVGFSFMYVVFNPLWSNKLDFTSFTIEAFANSLFYSVLLIFGYQFWKLYKKHMDTKTFVLA